MRWEYIPRDDELIATINQAEQHLWETYIVPDVAPPIDGSDATAEAIAARWPRQHGVELIADDPAEVADAVAAYRVALAEGKAAEVAKAEAVNRMAALLQGADVLTDAVGNKLMALKRGQFREKAFREEEPDADLWMHKVEVVNRDLLKTEDPELYRRYQSTSIYVPKGK
ncbi:hypothetical protein [Mycobacteroides abscessus]|uniref:hypothetical protein n=1 Tax=Mycobacteroides abscessus TaxID=36809 RepID=UPI000AC31013|nr:hypothetical protein [Mycobacteroides abscessus]